MDYVILRAELLSDPLSRGYSIMTPAQIADSLNAPVRSRVRASMSGDEVFQATNAAEFSALTFGVEKRQLWLAFCARENINPGAAANVAFVQFLFGAGSATVSALTAARQENISRAEELGLERMTPEHVNTARNS